jgi:acyl-phosphate glycerol 3-phosphate acyltransferase
MSLLVAAALGYAIGAAPLIYLLARRRGLDLYRLGTGNVGAGNLWRHGGPRLGTLAVVIEIGKGVVTPLAVRAVGLGLSAEVVAALAAVCGQMWPVTLRFQGGRGNGVGGGALFSLSPPIFAVAFVLFLVLISPKALSFLRHGEGTASKRSSIVPIAVPLSMAAYGVVALYLGHVEAGVAAFGTIGLILFRRLTAPWPPDPETGRPPEKSLVSVLLLDRPTFRAQR